MNRSPKKEHEASLPGSCDVKRRGCPAGAGAGLAAFQGRPASLGTWSDSEALRRAGGSRGPACPRGKAAPDAAP